MRKTLIGFVALLALAMVVPAAFADTDVNIVANGTFQTTATFNANGWADLTAGSTELPGWTVGGNGVDVVNWYWQAPPSGGNSVDLSGYNAGLTSQLLDTVPVGSYWNISFWMAANPDNSTDPQLESPAVKTVQVTFGNQSWQFTVDGTGASHENMNWQLVTINHIYIDSTPTAITFTSLTPGAFGPVIGGVSVMDPAPVPEPASMVLLGSGLIGLAGLFRRKRLQA